MKIKQRLCPKIFHVDYKAKLGKQFFNEMLEFNLLQKNNEYKKLKKNLKLKPLLPKFRNNDDKVIYYFNDIISTKISKSPELKINTFTNNNLKQNTNISNNNNLYSNYINNNINTLNNNFLKKIVFSQESNYSNTLQMNNESLEENISKLINPFSIKHYNKKLFYSNSANNLNITKKIPENTEDENKDQKKLLYELNNHFKRKPIISLGFFKRNYSTISLDNYKNIKIPLKNKKIFNPKNVITLYKNSFNKKFIEISEKEYKNEFQKQKLYKPVINIKSVIHNFNATKNDKFFNVRINKVQNYTLKRNILLDKNYFQRNNDCLYNFSSMNFFTPCHINYNNSKNDNEFLSTHYSSKSIQNKNKTFSNFYSNKKSKISANNDH